MEFRFNIGDKVRVRSHIGRHCIASDLLFSSEMKKYEGKKVTIVNRSLFGGFPAYTIKEDKNDLWGHWIWAEEWLEPVNKNDTVTISFTARTKEEAKEKARKIIEKSFAPKDWTSDEISAAQTRVIYLASKVIAEGGDVKFIKSGKAIFCKVYKSSFQLDNQINGIATPKGQDVPNDWIGKCVALCSALHEPIPFFITNKNR